MELKCCVQNYPWGKLGSNSEVALLCSSHDDEFTINENLPYAEMWMGTHVNCPSVVKSTGEKLGNWILKHESSLGDGVIRHFGKDLPFLFKVLSVNHALSIQAHPDKGHAEMLHKHHPEIYRDPNHKPELAIALTSFEALCGFRPLKEISHFLKEIPELQRIVGEGLVSDLAQACTCTNSAKELLKQCLHKLLTCPKEKLEEELRSLLTRIDTLGDKSHNLLGQLLIKLHTQFPGDIGCLCIYFFNYIVLKPGESIYLDSNEPHAYLSGDCVECMACSDNVVRAGLTPKYKDIETLCEMLTYNCEPPSAKLFQPVAENQHTLLYRPPVPDFSVAAVTIPSGKTDYTLIPRTCASILLVVEGQGTSTAGPLKRGSVIFLPANEECRTTCLKSLKIFQAFANV